MLLIDGRLDRALSHMPSGSDWQTLLSRAFVVGPPIG
jgi:hypothetical protein